MFPFSSNISLSDKILFFESISNLLDGGVSLIASISSFTERINNGKFKAVLQNTVYFLQSGDSLSTAMRKIPDFYTQKEIAIIESGEQTGMLKETFLSIAKDLRNQEDLRRKIANAMAYPVIILFFLILSLSIVMIYVIPQILPIITSTGTNLGWSTRSLVATSDFLRNNILLLIGGAVTLILLINWYSHTEDGRRFFDRQKLSFPVISRIYKNTIIVQVMSTFHLLSGSGVSIVQALRLTGASAGNMIIDELYKKLADSVAHGEKFSSSLQNLDPNRTIFTLDILQMLESAEKTSTLAPVSLKISEQYRREVDASLATLVKFIEPLALLLAGWFVLWFAIAIFSAIMQVVSIAWV